MNFFTLWVITETIQVLELPPIPEERTWICFKSPLVDYPETKISLIFDTSNRILRKELTYVSVSHHYL